MAFQRKAKMKPATLREQDDTDHVSKLSLIKFCDRAVKELTSSNDPDAALRFEILRDYLMNDFRGQYLHYEHRALGL